MRPTPLIIASLASAALLSACAGGKSSGAGPTAGEQYEKNPIYHQTTETDIALTKSTEPMAAGAATLYVNGMGCPLCATNIDLQLERVKGVQSVYVDLGIGKVDLTLGGKERPSPARLADAVADAGFTLVKIETR